jgi:MarR family transcriptional regulator, 2-MHQ and catechol-resistance regulon repressor
MVRKKEDRSGVHLWLVLMKAHQALHRRALKSITATGLCYSDFAVLEILLHKGSLPVNVLGSKVALTSGSATAAIDRLEKKGLVRRADDPRDRRARIVHLTPKGESLVRSAFLEHEADMDTATRGLTAAERSTAIHLLKRLGKYAADESQRAREGETESETAEDKH